MAPPRSTVVRAGDAGRHPLASSSPPVAAQPSTPDFQPGVEHGEDTLTSVPAPKPPSSKSYSNPSTPSRSPLARNTRHTAAGVARVPQINEAAIAQGIENMKDGATGLLDKWPLSRLVRLVWGAKETQTAEAAAQMKQSEAAALTKESEAAAQTKQSEAIAQDIPETLQEVDMMSGVAPPPYPSSK